ncbi:MAG: hypothetical protein ACHREM_25310, partial [Polyangiales bacterium]
PKATPAKRPARAGRAPVKSRERAPRAATPSAPAKDTNLRDRLLGVLDRENGMSRSQLLTSLGLDNRHEAKLGTALIRLRSEKLVSMEGNRRGATYKLS